MKFTLVQLGIEMAIAVALLSAAIAKNAQGLEVPVLWVLLLSVFAFFITKDWNKLQEQRTTTQRKE